MILVGAHGGQSQGGGGAGQVTSLFQSDWSHLTGATSPAITDNDKWADVYGGGHSVVTAASLGVTLPANMANLYRSRALDANDGWCELRVEGFAVPGAGDERHYRWYMVFNEPDDAPDEQQHPIQDATITPPNSIINWAFITDNGGVAREQQTTGWAMGTDRWAPEFWNEAVSQFEDGARWVLPQGEFLYKDTRAYRFHFWIEIVTLTTCRFHCDVYDLTVSDTVPLYTDADWQTPGGTWTLSDNLVMPLVDVDGFRGVNCGVNGITNIASDFDSAHYGGFVVAGEDPGAYGGAEGEAT